MKTEGIFEKIPGLNTPGLILLAARPGMGKTYFALNIARIVAEKKLRRCFHWRCPGSRWPLGFSHLRHRLRVPPDGQSGSDSHRLVFYQFNK